MLYLRLLFFELSNSHYTTFSSVEHYLFWVAGVASFRYNKLVDGNVPRLMWVNQLDDTLIPSEIVGNKMNISDLSHDNFEDNSHIAEAFLPWVSLNNRVDKGLVPAFNWVDPLQSEKTGIIREVIDKGRKPKGKILDYYSMDKLPDKYDYSILFQTKDGVKTEMFRLSRPHFEKGKPLGYHMDVKIDLPEYVQKYFCDKKEITENDFLRLKNFGKIGKLVRIAGKVFLVAGVALDLLELKINIDADLKDVDKKLGKKTISTVARIGGRWGAALLAKAGAAIGLSAGPASPIVSPVLGWRVLKIH